MPLTRSRLGEQLARRLRRWRSTAVPILQAAAAAGLSWLVAVSSSIVRRSSRRSLPSCASASHSVRAMLYLPGDNRRLIRLVDGLIRGATGLLVGVLPRGACPGAVVVTGTAASGASS
jgi:hypothetical protein